MRCFISPSASIVKEQQQRLIPATLRRVPVRGREQGVHFLLLQVTDRDHRGLFERYDTDLAAPFDVLWTVQADEVSQRMDCGQALVARPHSTAPLFFDFLKEGPNPIGREVFNSEPINRSPPLAGNEWQQQAERVAVALLRAAG
jgi:hypothetical protein